MEWPVDAAARDPELKRRDPEQPADEAFAKVHALDLVRGKDRNPPPPPAGPDQQPVAVERVAGAPSMPANAHRDHAEKATSNDDRRPRRLKDEVGSRGHE